MLFSIMTLLSSFSYVLPEIVSLWLDKFSKMTLWSSFLVFDFTIITYVIFFILILSALNISHIQYVRPVGNHVSFFTWIITMYLCVRYPFGCVIFHYLPLVLSLLFEMTVLFLWFTIFWFGMTIYVLSFISTYVGFCLAVYICITT